MKNEYTNYDSKKFKKNLKEYCLYCVNEGYEIQINDMLEKFAQNPDLLPNDFYIVNKENFLFSVRVSFPRILYDDKYLDGYFERFLDFFNKFYKEEKTKQIEENDIILMKKNENKPNKEKIKIVLKDAFKKIYYESNDAIVKNKYSKEIIYNFILQYYYIFPQNFDIVSTSNMAMCILSSINRTTNSYGIANIVELSKSFNKYYLNSKKTIESNKKRKKLNYVNIAFDGYRVHLQAKLISQLNTLNDANSFQKAKFESEYENELKKCDLLYDSVISLYDNLDDFEKIDSYIVYNAINKVTSLKDFFNIPFTYLVEIFKEEFKKSKENNYTTQEILSKFKKITPETLEKIRNQQKQKAIEEYMNNIIEINEQIDEYNSQKANEQQGKISNMSSKINQKKDKIRELSCELKKQKEELEALENQLEEVKKQEVKYELKMINEEMLFKWCEDHFEIKNEYINHLNEYNLSAIIWNNVKVSGIDFSITNAELNPQEVYKKDISNCKFKDANLRDLNINYTGVDLRETDIHEEISMPGVEYSIYDEKTKFSNEIINYLTSLERNNSSNQSKIL